MKDFYKIYLATTEEVQNLDTSFVGIAYSDPQDIIEPIEYIRKDVVDGMLATAEDHAYFAGSESQRVKSEKMKDNFIKKATSYIKQNWIWNKKIIEDFVNYMKG